jgi:hypothetical protein
MILPDPGQKLLSGNESESEQLYRYLGIFGFYDYVINFVELLKKIRPKTYRKATSAAARQC